MIRFRTACLLAWLPLATGAPAPPPCRASTSGPDTLADHTSVERWTLDNGLCVTTRNIPDAGGVAVTVGYRFGSDQDPEGREGLAQLLGRLVFLAPAGDFPDRTPEELESQRPHGWSYTVTRRATLLTEVVSIDQFPGALREFATRMRGITVDPQALREAIRNVLRERTRQAFGPPEAALDFRVREVALWRSDQETARRAAAQGLDRISVREVREHLGRRFVPSNATLSLAGNLDEVDLHPLVQNLFGDIPPGTALPQAPPVFLKPGGRVIRHPDLAQAVGVVGVISPAIEDTLHPSFLLATLLIGNHFGNTWQMPNDPVTSRYQYAVLDEPDLVRLYPWVAADETRLEALSGAAQEALDRARSLIFTEQILRGLCSPLVWLMGGPMPPDSRLRITSNPAALHTLARSMAACSMWGGEEFWAGYRRRLQQLPAGDLDKWIDYFLAPEHQVRLLMVPGK